MAVNGGCGGWLSSVIQPIPTFIFIHSDKGRHWLHDMIPTVGEVESCRLTCRDPIVQNLRRIFLSLTALIAWDEL